MAETKTRRDELADALYIVWVDYGSEGWQPTPFDSTIALASAIENGEFHAAFIVTQPRSVTVRSP